MHSTKLRGARTHNLKSVSLDLEPGTIVAVAGPSGSGKSSLALDTLYAEGQRRFVESFSPYARQFLERLERPPIDTLDPVAAGVAVDRRAPVKSSRSTVATMSDLKTYIVDAATGSVLWTIDEVHTQTQIGSGTGANGEPKKMSTTQVAGGFRAHDQLRPAPIRTFDTRGSEVTLNRLLLPPGPPVDGDFSIDADNTWADPPVVDAPRVGHGLQDHPACFVLWSAPALRNLWEEATAENVAPADTGHRFAQRSARRVHATPRHRSVHSGRWIHATGTSDAPAGTPVRTDAEDNRRMGGTGRMTPTLPPGDISVPVELMKLIRAGRVRVSPHAYNVEDEIDRFLDAVK